MAITLQRFQIPVVPPFSLYYTARVLQRLPANRVDRSESGVYGRLLPVGERYELVTVTQSGDSEHPGVEVSARLSPAEIAGVQATIQQLLGTALDLSPFYAMIRRNGPLLSLATALSGLKPPRFPSLFEALANAICGQQGNLSVGLLTMNRLAESAGSHRVIHNEKYLAFPAAEQVCRLKPDHLRVLGLSSTRAAALYELSEGFASGRLRPEEIEQLSTPHAMERLQSLSGVGAWSASYALLRGLGRLEVFPVGDVSAARTLGELLGKTPLTPEEAEAFALQWKEYAGLLYFHLWGNRYLPEEQGRLGLSRVPVQIPLS